MDGGIQHYGGWHMTKNKDKQKDKSGITPRNEVIRNKAVKILQKESPLTTQQIIERLYTEHNTKYNLPSTRQLSAYLTRDSRFKKTGTVLVSMISNSPRILWGLN